MLEKEIMLPENVEHAVELLSHKWPALSRKEKGQSIRSVAAFFEVPTSKVYRMLSKIRAESDMKESAGYSKKRTTRRRKRRS